MGAEFCDTNVFVYAYATTAGPKRPAAKRVLERRWDSGDGAVSVQVIQELYVTLRTGERPTASPDTEATGPGGSGRACPPRRRMVMAALWSRSSDRPHPGHRTQRSLSVSPAKRRPQAEPS